MIFLVCLLLELVILGVMGGNDCTKFIEDWIGLYVMECFWMNGILVRFLLKIALTIPLFLLVLLVIL